MALFGRYLAERGVLSAAQIEEATQAQVVYGGRLGTNLIELGHLTIEQMERYLSDYLNVPTCPPVWLECPTVDALAAVPVEMVERHCVLPLRIEGRKLHIAMLSPVDLRVIQEVRSAAGLRIEPYVIAEVRLFALLEHYYELPRDVRYVDIERRARANSPAPIPLPADETSFAPPRREAAATDALTRLVDEERAALGISPLGLDQELIDEESFTSLHADSEGNQTESDPEEHVATRAADTAPAASPANATLAMDLDEELFPDDADDVEVGDDGAGGRAGEALAATEIGDETQRQRREGVSSLEAALAAARDRDEVSRIALEIGRCYAEAVALFMVRGGVVSGFRGDGEAIRERLEGILLPVESDSTAGRAASKRAPHRVRPEGGLDAILLDALGRKDVTEFGVQPVVIQGHVSNLLYCDNGMEPLPETAFAALGALAELVSQAYERLILYHKAQLRAPPAADSD